MGEYFVDLKRPCIAVVKLVEAIGILLHVPLSYEKSAFKTESPTNYDATVNNISTNYDMVLQQLIEMQSSAIPNDIASQFYKKMEEPGFSYEEAVNQGGLAARDLFNCVIYIIFRLQSDEARIPLTNTNVMVVVNGTRSSYVALDVAAHIHSHGVLNVAAVTLTNSNLTGQNELRTHLPSDLIKRCRQQYKIPDYLVKVSSFELSSDEYLKNIVVDEVKDNGCRVLVVGIESSSLVSSGLETLTNWAAWSPNDTPNMTILLAKSCARVPEFSERCMSRKFIVCVKRVEKLLSTFVKCLELMKPGDSIVLLSVVGKTEESKPNMLQQASDSGVAGSGKKAGSDFDTRFGFGHRKGMWVKTPHIHHRHDHHHDHNHINHNHHKNTDNTDAATIANAETASGLLNVPVELAVEAATAVQGITVSGRDSGSLPISPQRSNSMGARSKSKAMPLRTDQKLETAMKELLAKSQIADGTVRMVHAGNTPKNIGQIICEVAYEESCDILFLHRGVSWDVPLECVTNALCSVALV